ncbi:MAG: HD domain-containing phosphohydrolase [Alphaproteobacteria bacterium]
MATETGLSQQGVALGQKTNRAILMAAGVLVALMAVAFYFAINFVNGERQRDLDSWQVRMGIVADSRTAAIAEWIDQNFATLRELTENSSLQFYMTQLVAGGSTAPGADDSELAQGGYLRNLLTATARRAGFVPVNSGGDSVVANVSQASEAGLALVDPQGHVVTSTPGTPPLPPQARAAIVKALGGEAAFIDMFLGATNRPTIGFVLPILSAQPKGANDMVGAVVGLRIADADLFGRLRQPGEGERTAENSLIRVTGGAVENLSPLKDGTASLHRSLALDTPELAAAFGQANPGGFAIKKDFEGKEVLVTSRKVPGTAWTMMRTITTEETLAPSVNRTRTLLIVFVLIIVGVSGGMIAVWRHGTSIRAAESAERFRVAAARFENLTNFMKLVTDGQPTAIIAVDNEGRYTFANKSASDEAGVPAEAMLGKSMANVIGPARARAFTDVNKDVLAKMEKRSVIHTFEGEESQGTRILKSEHIPLPGDSEHPPGVLMVIEDITQITRERERREGVLRQLTNTLVGVVDRRDPYSANHSARVAEVARNIAEEMGISPLEASTVEISGRLMNLGKILIPTELLTKRGDLTPAERDLLSRSFVVSAEMLEGVDFDGPVVETIREIGEVWDGSGPLGLKGEAIRTTSRIVSVANTFVGMVSARAWRAPMTFEKCSQILFEQAEKKFDRRAVLALMNVLDNRGGASRWAHFRELPKDAG